MILTLTPNPALDVTYHVDRIAVGDTQRVDDPNEQAGGKGVNVARVLRQVGQDVLAVLPVGGATGTQLLHDLDRIDLPHVGVPVDTPSRRTVTVVDRSAGDNLVLAERGHPLSPSDLAAVVDAVDARLDQARCLVVSGSLPPDTPLSMYADLVSRAHGRGLPALVDTSGPGLLAAARAGADLVKPNRHELREALGLDDPVEGARALLLLGAARVVVSLGGDGLLLVTADQVARARLPEPLHGNPSGAGDAAVAALATGLAANAAPADLARTATAWSAAAVLTPFAGALHPSYLDLGERVVLQQES